MYGVQVPKCLRLEILKCVGALIYLRARSGLRQHNRRRRQSANHVLGFGRANGKPSVIQWKKDRDIRGLILREEGVLERLSTST